ncbi:MAG TPA: alpha/beta fold hydrolase [Candidatus Acidoferrum sp.]|nr:alpha/beta fold hydrolase [Candidatus Acidoferrum sp.]
MKPSVPKYVSPVRKHLKYLSARHQRGWRSVLVLAFVLPLAACTQRTSTTLEKSSETLDATEEAVHFASGKITLAGTLLLPAGSGRHPAVVLFHGSGAQQRDLFTARWFADQGIAALAYDKRGVGESTGNFRAVPFMDLCDDGLAAIEYLKSRKEIYAKRIGVWGLSQGGWLGPLAASRSADVSFVIAVSGPGVSTGEQMIVYYANELRTQGVPESDVREASAVRRDIWNYMSNGNGYEKAKKELEQARTKGWFGKAKVQQDDSFGTLPTPAELSKQPAHSTQWFKQEAVYDPVPTLRALRVPALFLYGDKDQLIPVPESVTAIRRVLAEDDHHDFTIREFPNDDHQMRLTTVEAYGEIDPEYLKTMREWLASRVH